MTVRSSSLRSSVSPASGRTRVSAEWRESRERGGAHTAPGRHEVPNLLLLELAPAQVWQLANDTD